MKKLMLSFGLLLLFFLSTDAQVGVNQTGNSPHASAALDVDFDNKGFLPPRMTTGERDAIVSPAVGLIIFNTDTECLDAWLGSLRGSSCFICMPQPSQANAGPDQETTSPLTLAANTASSGTGAWSVISGDGNEIISNAANPVSGFEGSVGETYTLRWTITTSCGNTYDDVSITIVSPCSSFEDSRDDHVYGAVQIGDQCWMSENLAYLPSVSGVATGDNTSQYFYVHGYNGTNVASAKATTEYQTYGALYNWPAAMAGGSSVNGIPSGIQGACPDGWHLPSDNEWCQMESYIGMTDPCGNTGWRGTDQGNQLKSTSWSGGTDDWGFSALPSGRRTTAGTFQTNFIAIWTTAESSGTNAWGREWNAGIIERVGYTKGYGFAVRCVKN